MLPDLVTIVIPTFNQLHHTRACLAALQQTLPPSLRARVHIVDNASQDGTPAYLAEQATQWPLLRWWGLEKNLGFTYASNFGAEKAASEFLVFLNNDTIPQPGWLEALLEPMGRSKIGIVGPKLVFPESGLINHAGYVLNRTLGGFYPIYQNLPQDAPWVNRPREYQALLGACLLMRRSLFFEVGAFDEIGLEDIALCLKVRERGLGVLYYPKSVVHHVGSATIKGEPLAFLKMDNLAFGARWPLSQLPEDDRQFYREDGYTLVRTTPQGVELREDISESMKLTESARHLRENGKTDEAIQNIRRAIDLYPHNEIAQVTALELFVSAGMLEEARDVGLKFLTLQPWNFSFYASTLNLCLATDAAAGFDRLRQQALEYPDLPSEIQSLVAPDLRAGQ